MSEAGNWCLIESDPGVFTELIREFGVTGLQVEELYSTEKEQFTDLKPVHGLIFLFKYRPGDEATGTPIIDNNQIFFAQQVIQNACATQAIINMILNMEQNSDIKFGKLLEDFKEFTQGMDAVNRGLCLGNSEPIRNVHNSFARPLLFEMDIKTAEKDENYHFVTYMPISGHVYELDGLREAPVDLGVVKDGEDWLDVVRPVIDSRIKKYSEGEIHFNLLAVISDLKMKYKQRYDELMQSEMEDDNKAAELIKLREMIALEDEKQKMYSTENKRRRHNYVPFIVELLKIFAKEGKLVAAVDAVRERDFIRIMNAKQAKRKSKK